MSSDPMVVIGGGLCGSNAAFALREAGHLGPVVVVAGETDPPYNRPPMSKGYLRGEEEFEVTLVRQPAEYRAADIDLRLDRKVTGIDPGEHILSLDDGNRLGYGRVLIATGGRNRRPPIPGLDLEWVCQLRTRPDSDRIRSLAARGAQVVVVGLGFIGCEVAASLRVMGAEVTALDFEPQPLARILGEQFGAAIARLHRSQGVEVVLGEGVSAFSEEGGKRSVVTTTGRRLECDFAVAGLGIEPAVELGRAAGTAIDNGILVDEYSRTSVADVFAAGDVANRQHPLYGRLRIEHWNNADRAGRAAAAGMLGRDEPFDDIPSFWSDQYDTTIEYVGHHTSHDRLVHRGDPNSQRFMTFYLSEGDVHAVAAIGFGDSIVDPLEPVVRRRGSPIPVERLEDEAVPLEKLTGPG